jgi:hypothetical protein
MKILAVEPIEKESLIIKSEDEAFMDYENIEQASDKVIEQSNKAIQ